MIKFIFTVSVLVITMTACASNHEARDTAAATDSSENIEKAKDQITDVATTPLNDLNLVHVDIPPVLLAAQQGPYLAPLNQTCEEIFNQVSELDAVLGADVDVPGKPKPGLVERGAKAAGKAAVGAFRGVAEGVVPYRSWVRKLTGAERYSKEVAAAISAGTVRRAFLKGIGYANGCVFISSPAVEAGDIIDSEITVNDKSVTTVQ